MYLVSSMTHILKAGNDIGEVIKLFSHSLTFPCHWSTDSLLIWLSNVFIWITMEEAQTLLNALSFLCPQEQAQPFLYWI